MNAALTDEPRQDGVLAAADTAYRWIAGILGTLTPTGASRVPADGTRATRVRDACTPQIAGTPGASL